MKNVHNQQLIAKAKAKHASRRNLHSQYQDGMLIRSFYPQHSPDGTASWAELQFRLNGYAVHLLFRTPQQAYQNKIYLTADEIIASNSKAVVLGKDIPGFLNIPPNSPTLSNAFFDNLDIINAEYDDAIRQAEASADYQIHPTLKSTWLPYGRFVQLTAPLVLRNTTDVKQLVSLTKQLLKQQITLAQAFPGFVYTRQDWLARANQV